MQWHLLGLVSLLVLAQAMKEGVPDNAPAGILLQCTVENLFLCFFPHEK